MTRYKIDTGSALGGGRKEEFVNADSYEFSDGFLTFRKNLQKVFSTREERVESVRAEDPKEKFPIQEGDGGELKFEYDVVSRLCRSSLSRMLDGECKTAREILARLNKLKSTLSGSKRGAKTIIYAGRKQIEDLVRHRQIDFTFPPGSGSFFRGVRVIEIASKDHLGVRLYGFSREEI